MALRKISGLANCLEWRVNPQAKQFLSLTPNAYFDEETLPPALENPSNQNHLYWHLCHESQWG